MGLHRSASFTPMKLVEGARVLVKEVRNRGKAEEVVIANEGHVDQPLTGWTLVSLQGVKVFRFEDGLVLRPGTSIRITSGEGVAHKPPTVFGWTDETVWNNRGDVALVFDYEGDEVTRFAYPSSRAEQAGRLPRHVLVRLEDGGYRVEHVRREPTRGRVKISRPGAPKTEALSPSGIATVASPPRDRNARRRRTGR